MYALNTEGCNSNCLLYRSFDQGRTWWPTVLPFSWSGSLALRSVDAREIYAWSNTMMWRSIDGGNRWTQLDTPTGHSQSRRITVHTGRCCVARSDLHSDGRPELRKRRIVPVQDKGANWRLISEWVPGITHLTVAGDPPTIYLAWRSGKSNGLQWSRDGGRSWNSPRDETTGDIANWRVNDFTTDISESDTLYAAMAGKGVFSISTLNPREHTVLWSSDTVELEVQSIATHPSDPGVLAIRTTDGLLITSDAGASWIPLHQAGYQIENVSYPRLPEGVNGPVVTTGSPWTICIGSVNGVWCHRGG